MALRERVRRRHRRVAQIVALTGVAVVGIATVRHQEPLAAQDTTPTFAKDVAPILYKNCTSCHRPGGLGPFSLLDYDSAKANVEEMRDAVESGFMPPWHAEGPHGTFRNDRRLSDLEKSTLVRWIDAGAKKGDEQQAPPRPVYATGWEIGTPDAIVTMPDAFVVPASGTVEYQYFEIPTHFTEDKWVSAIEFMPGAREVVHHVLVYAKVPAPENAAPAAPRPAGSPAPRPLFVPKPQYDAPEAPPRQDSRHVRPRQLGVLIGGTAPGTNVMTFPVGTAIRVRAGTVLTFQMHYTAHGHEMTDRTSVGFRFASEMPDEEMRLGAYINGAFTLPAGRRDIAVTADLEPTEPIKLWGLLPHTHLRGKRWQYTLEKPDGTSQLVLDVPRYDFNWQTYYFFNAPIDIPAGGKLISTAWYDNSATNKSNPDASKDVKWGEQTWEEMQYTGFMYTVPSRRLKPAPK